MNRYQKYEKKRKQEMRSLCLRMTPEEKDLLSKKAAFCNLTMNDYLRKSIRENYIYIEDWEGKKQVMHEIGKVGTNVNQIARIVNENGNINDEEMQEVLKCLNEIKQIVIDKL